MNSSSSGTHTSCRFTRLRLSHALLSIALVASVAGCKSDGGGDTVDVPSEPGFSNNILSSYFVKSFAAFEDAAARLRENTDRYTIQKNTWRFKDSNESYNSYPLASARIEYAHAAGLTGKGQIVSVIDSGFLTAHETLDGKRLYMPDYALEPGDHGTAVASVLGGLSSKMIGVAPGADLALGEFTSMKKLAVATREATKLQAVAQNNSWGFPTVPVTQEGFNQVFGSQGGVEYLSALDAYTRDGVVVFAVTNDEPRTGASLMEALPALRSSLEAGWLAVVNAVPDFDNNRILSAKRISAGCLETARWCLTADGGWTAASGASPTSYEFVTGSSFAAPQVSGALALLGEAFPHMAPHDLRIRLLASADNGFYQHDAEQELVPGFFHGYNEEFGHGFLDVRAALLPIGTPTVRMEGGDTIAVDTPLFVSGRAAGDAIAASLAQHEVLITDSLAGDFLIGGETLVGRTAAAPLMEQRLTFATSGSLKAARLEDTRTSQDLFSIFPSLSFELGGVEDGPEFEFMLPAPGTLQANFGVAMEQQWDTSWGVAGLGVSLLQDDAGLLGATGGPSAGALAGALDIGAAVDLVGDGFLSVRGQFGVADGHEGPYADITSTSFSSYVVEMGKQNAFTNGDRLTLSVEMPTALTSGAAHVDLPVARASGGELMYQDLEVELSPKSREMNIALRYQAPLGDNWEVMAEALHSINRGHVGNENSTGGLIGFSMKF